MKKNLRSPNQKGFTIIELIVVMAIFLFIIGAVVGIFVSVVQNQAKVLVEQEFLNQVSYAEEYISKALRMAAIDEDGACLTDNPGSSYLLTRYDTASQTYAGIKFINTSDDNACVEFFVDNYTHGNLDTPLVLKQLKNSSDINSALNLTPREMEIESARFVLNGSLDSTGEELIQPRVTILLRVKVPGNQEPYKTIQTTVSQRNLNIRQ